MNTAILVTTGLLCAVVLVLIVLFFKQLKGLLLLILNTALGWAGLYIFNLIFASSGFLIGVNIASATVVGVLGIPGLLLMIILKFIYKGL